MSGESLGSIVGMPGLAEQSMSFKKALLALAARHGWNVDAIAAVISQESRYNPRAKNPNGTAYGLIQWIDSTKKAIGTSQAELEQMSGEQQLVYVEKYFDMMLRGRKPERAGDYYLATYGRTDAFGKPDSYVLDRKDSEDPNERKRYAWNAGLDKDKDGAITAGDIRGVLERFMKSAESKPRVYVFDDVSITSPKLLVTMLVLGVAGYILFSTVLMETPKRKALA